MSGNASLSAAKNRRSGNEVKISGQNKQAPPPPQKTRQQQQGQQQCQSQQQCQQQGQQQEQHLQRPPHPMDILKSHELRLREIESSTVEQDLLSLKDNDLKQLKQRMTELNQVIANITKEVELVKALLKNNVAEIMTVGKNNISLDISSN